MLGIAATEDKEAAHSFASPAADIAASQRRKCSSGRRARLARPGAGCAAPRDRWTLRRGGGRPRRRGRKRKREKRLEDQKKDGSRDGTWIGAGPRAVDMKPTQRASGLKLGGEGVYSQTEGEEKTHGNGLQEMEVGGP